MFRKKIEADLDFLSWHLRFSQLGTAELRNSVLPLWRIVQPL
jgi:hypothetical protein